MPDQMTSSVMAVVIQENTRQQLTAALEASTEFNLLEMVSQTDGLIKKLHNKTDIDTQEDYKRSVK